MRGVSVPMMPSFHGGRDVQGDHDPGIEGFEKIAGHPGGGVLQLALPGSGSGAQRTAALEFPRPVAEDAVRIDALVDARRVIEVAMHAAGHGTKGGAGRPDAGAIARLRDRDTGAAGSG
jgi:hypothetical protein